MRKVLIIVLMVSLFTGCFLSNKISNQNLAYVYRSNLSVMHPEFMVYNFSDDSSRLFFKVNTEELLYTKQDDQRFSSIVRVQYMFFNSIDAQAFTDSGSVTIKDSRGDSVSNILMGHFDLKTGSIPYSILQLKLTDVNRKQYDVFFVKIDKSTKQSRQTFQVYLKGSKQPYFHNYVSSKDSFIIKNRDTSVTKLFVKYYNRSFKIAPPPFAVENPQGFDYHPDSLYMVDID